MILSHILRRVKIIFILNIWLVHSYLSYGVAMGRQRAWDVVVGRQSAEKKGTVAAAGTVGRRGRGGRSTLPVQASSAGSLPPPQLVSAGPKLNPPPPGGAWRSRARGNGMEVSISSWSSHSWCRWRRMGSQHTGRMPGSEWGRAPGEWRQGRRSLGAWGLKARAEGEAGEEQIGREQSEAHKEKHGGWIPRRKGETSELATTPFTVSEASQDAATATPPRAITDSTFPSVDTAGGGTTVKIGNVFIKYY